MPTVRENMKTREFSYTTVVNVKSYNYFGKLKIPYEVNHIATYNPVISVLSIYSRKMKAYDHTKTCIIVIIEALFVMAPQMETT